MTSTASQKRSGPGPIPIALFAVFLCGCLALLVVGFLVNSRRLSPQPKTSPRHFGPPGHYASDKPATEKETALLAAIDAGDLDGIKYVMGEQPDVNAGFEFGNTVLHELVSKQMPPGRGRTYERGRSDATLEVLAMLLSRGADPNIRNDMGQTPLFGAQSSAVAEALIVAGADIEAADMSHKTPIFGMVNGEAVGDLVAHHVNVNAIDEQGETPLHGAARLGLDDVAEVLVKAGANVNARNLKGQTPLKLARLSFRREIVLLLELHRASG